MPAEDAIAKAVSDLYAAAGSTNRKRIDVAVRALIMALARARVSGTHRVHRMAGVLRELVFGKTSERPGALDAAVELGRYAHGYPQRDHELAAWVALMHGVALATRRSWVHDLDESIAALRSADESAGDNRDLRVIALSYLRELPRVRYEHTSDGADLDLAVDAAERLLEWPNDQARTQLNLTESLLRRYEHADRPEDLARAREAAERAISLAPEEPRPLSCLASVLRYQHRRQRDVAALRRSIELLRAALRLEPDSAEIRANLGLSLNALFEATDDTRVLDEAISVQRAVVAQRTTDDDPVPARDLVNLGRCLGNRFHRYHHLADLTEAIAAYRKASSRDYPTRYVARSGLALALASHALTPAGTPADLAEAIEIMQDTLDNLPSDHHARPMITRNLAMLWQDQHAGAARLDEAVRFAESATGEVAGSRVARFDVLGTALEKRFRDSGSEEDRVRAIAAFTEAAGDPLADVHARISAGSSWGALAARAGEWASATAGYRIAVDAFAQSAPAELRRSDQEHNLRHPGLAADAAACALRHGDATEALRLLERGRGVLLTQALGQPPQAGGAVTGPVVAVNVSEHGCAAIIVTGSRVRTVPLPELTLDAVLHRIGAFQYAVEITEFQHAFDVDDVWAASRFVARLLRWLWDVVAEPILSTMDIPVGGKPPRLWWMPVGPLAFLPLHAAGYHVEQDGRTVLDRVISSYTPTIAALRHATATEPGPGVPVSPLAVGVSHVDGYPELTGARREIEALRTLLPGIRVLRDEQATRAKVCAAIANSDLVHFACHATSRATDPSSGHLVLADGPLTVTEIADGHTPDAWLAYLSACATGRTGITLPDEAIHIASAFQQAGYPHVISTLWPISDEAEFAERVYTELLGKGSHPADAVHAATRDLRDHYAGGHPLHWAAHAHTGP
ncbi:CHAT domain-containing protein [Amycolatopsis sp. NPDC058986]|uniref:CHAT domain-containing protein n=1 Tax=unclassified Amycolatopsis TaxID=2618356 RepID=UPI003672CE0C